MNEYQEWDRLAEEVIQGKRQAEITNKLERKEGLKVGQEAAVKLKKLSTWPWFQKLVEAGVIERVRTGDSNIPFYAHMWFWRDDKDVWQGGIYSPDDAANFYHFYGDKDSRQCDTISFEDWIAALRSHLTKLAANLGCEGQ